MVLPLLIWNCVRRDDAFQELPTTGFTPTSPDSIWRVANDCIKYLIDKSAAYSLLFLVIRQQIN
jgi:hypothetical protein